MGYSLSWLAVKGKSTQDVLLELGFRPTGARLQLPEADLCAAQLPNGWYLVVSDHTAKVVPDDALDRLSANGAEIVTCFVEEHVMCSVAIGWRSGRRTWSVIHDTRYGTAHLQVDGDLPSEFASIRDRFLAKQREEDQCHAPKRHLLSRRKVPLNEMRCDYIFEIPVVLAQALTGYRHDQDIPGSDDRPGCVPVPGHSESPTRAAFEVLTRTGPADVSTIPDLDPAQIAEARLAIRRRGLKLLAIGAFLFTLLLLLVYWLAAHSFHIHLPLIGSSVPFVLACVGAIELISGYPFYRLGAKWMSLAGWQRGVLGTLIVLGALILMLILGTAIGMLLT